MEENIYYIELFDTYGELLTDKQKEYFKDYYFENLTLEEIASNDEVSKNAVSKQLKTVKSILTNYEDKVKFVEYKKSIKNEFSNEIEILNRIDKYDII